MADLQTTRTDRNGRADRAVAALGGFRRARKGHRRRRARRRGSAARRRDGRPFRAQSVDRAAGRPRHPPRGDDPARRAPDARQPGRATSRRSSTRERRGLRCTSRCCRTCTGRCRSCAAPASRPAWRSTRRRRSSRSKKSRPTSIRCWSCPSIRALAARLSSRAASLRSARSAPCSMRPATTRRSRSTAAWITPTRGGSWRQERGILVAGQAIFGGGDAERATRELRALVNSGPATD